MNSLGEVQFFVFFEELNQIEILIPMDSKKTIREDLMSSEGAGLDISPVGGFLLRTTKTTAQMRFQGLSQKYKNLTFFLSHFGGAIPFMYPQRGIRWLVRADSHPIRNIPNLPRHDVKNHFDDTALSCDPSPLRVTIDLAGVDHFLWGHRFSYPTLDRHVPRKPHPSGWGKGAQYKRKLPYREAPPLRAGSFTLEPKKQARKSRESASVKCRQSLSWKNKDGRGIEDQSSRLKGQKKERGYDCLGKVSNRDDK